MKCLVVQPIHADGLECLRAAGVTPVEAPTTRLPDLQPLLRDADAIITRNWGLPGEALALAPKLRVVGVHGTGTDRIDKAGLRKRGIALVSTPGSNARSVAEHCLALLLALARGVPGGHQAMQSGDFAYRERFKGRELFGARLGLWGWGHVSRAFAAMAPALGMHVTVHSRHANEAELAAMGCSLVPNLDDFLGGADVISLHGVPGDKPVLGAREIARMRPDAILLNTARGALVDEDALSAALRDGHLFGAALDVFSEEPLPVGSSLIGCPRLLLTPHIGGSTEAALRRTAQQVAQAVVAELLMEDR